MLVTRLSGKIDELIAPREPPRNGTHTTSTRSAGSAVRLKMLLCTQLAPARQVAQVGEKISTRRGWPLSRLNSDLKVEIPVSDTTPPLRDAVPGPLDAAPGPLVGAPGEHDASTEPAATAAATAAARDVRRLRHANLIPVRSLWPAISMTPPSMRSPRRTHYLYRALPGRDPLHDPSHYPTGSVRGAGGRAWMEQLSRSG